MRAEAFPKAARIRRRREFLEVQRGGARAHSKHFVVIQQPGRGRMSRLGVTVSSRVGNAVARNRTKRIVRELFRQYRRTLSPPTDFVVIAKPGADTLRYAEAATELDPTLRRP